MFCFALLCLPGVAPPLFLLTFPSSLQHFHFHRIFMNSHSALCSTYFSGQQMHSPYFSCQHTHTNRERETEQHCGQWAWQGGGGSKPGVGIMFSAFCCKEFFAQAINLMCVMCCSRHTLTHTYSAHTHRQSAHTLGTKQCATLDCSASPAHTVAASRGGFQLAIKQL